MTGSWHLMFREQNLRRKILYTATEYIEACMLNVQEKPSREKTDNRKMPYLYTYQRQRSNPIIQRSWSQTRNGNVESKQNSKEFKIQSASIHPVTKVSVKLRKVQRFWNSNLKWIGNITVYQTVTIFYRKWHKRIKESGKSCGGIVGKWVIFLTLELVVYWLLGLIFMQILVDTKGT